MRAPAARRRAAPVRARHVRTLPKQQCGWLPYLWGAVSLDARQSDADRGRHRQEAPTVMKSQGADQIETLQRETAKLKKINAALMSRVERSIDQQFNAFSLFE